jgi:hypothetical protein
MTRVFPIPTVPEIVDRGTLKNIEEKKANAENITDNQYGPEDAAGPSSN